MPNSKSEHSRALRQRTASARRAQIIADGGLHLTVLIRKPAADALRALTADGATKTEVVSEALLTAAKSKAL